MMTKIKLLMLIIFYLIISASAHAAGGIALGATRIIYPADAKQTAVWIRNSHTNERFLVNSWIENSSGVKEKSFIITPPLFVREVAIKWSAAPDMTPQTVLYRRPVAQFSNFQPKIVSSWLILA
ncbi:fimbria/pilus periplasmic chaperone, partial [Escherichia coli]|uniref:fimbria/pilus periplasmic chaperone n=1 Tax=Escherichia coli TaxID=562 RepID=UPI00200DB562